MVLFSLMSLVVVGLLVASACSDEPEIQSMGVMALILFVWACLFMAMLEDEGYAIQAIAPTEEVSK